MRWEVNPSGNRFPSWLRGQSLTRFPRRGQPQEPHLHLVLYLRDFQGVCQNHVCHVKPAPHPDLRLRLYTHYCAKAIILIPPSHIHLLCLCFTNGLSHIIFTYTLLLISRDLPGSNCGFCACGLPHHPYAYTRHFSLKGATPPCQLSSYNGLQTQEPNGRIYTTWKHNYSSCCNCYYVNCL